MCGILCMYNTQDNLNDKTHLFHKMLTLMNHRGPDDCRVHYEDHVLLGHCRLSIIDLQGGKQPFEYTYQGITYQIIFNGEIYNMNSLKQQLIDEGFHFHSQSDSEVLLVSYIAYKEKCLNKLEGIFSFIVSYQDKLFIARDHLGVKPLYYLHQDHTFIFASEIKSILLYLGKAVVDQTGIKELLGLGPSLTPGRTLYQNIYSLRAGHYMYIDHDDYYLERYWQLERKYHPHNYEQTVKHVRSLVNESIHQQLLSDVPISCMLSGGLDSSIITALATQYVNHVSTYSIDYQDQDQYFKPYDYQMTKDSDYIDDMVNRYQTNHYNVVLSQKNLIMFLKQSMIARDGPGMADIDSSFLLFCKEIHRHHKVVLSGECADEIFGGYPWFYKKELYSLDTFPWIRDIDKRLDLLNEKTKNLHIKEYVKERYLDSLAEIDYFDHHFYDSNKRKMMYLNMEWFMQTLLTRSDSQSMYNGVELRVPFASKKIVEYMYNVPWEYMYQGNREKGLLRDAFQDFLPEDIYNRKKNPYPKTHSPFYLSYIKNLLIESLSDKNNILFQLFDENKLKEMIEHSDKIHVPWFGQLMMGPQLLAYFYQIYIWGKLYHIELHF
ncbi:MULTISPECIES: asparagine synthase (glutamine-hydrolyzing) [Coprobacillaceae]|uniref:asparagine synthase (glutamine-hydrolyzing) n=1 Tax=Coprobacillaceae TaxID=2810280 RepID=UPI001F37F652|nr:MULTISPECIES: asparagine synthase (glutamine-hydrolyzing) [Coprobacillaceae]